MSLPNTPTMDLVGCGPERFVLCVSVVLSRLEGEAFDQVKVQV